MKRKAAKWRASSGSHSSNYTCTSLCNRGDFCAFPFCHKILERCKLKGWDLIKLKVVPTLSRTFLSETSFCFFPFNRRCVTVKNTVPTRTLCRHCLGSCWGASSLTRHCLVLYQRKCQYSEKGKSCFSIIMKIGFASWTSWKGLRDF